MNETYPKSLCLPPPSKDCLIEAALLEIPKILTLLDRNAHSPTFGCFDRNYWHYRIVDFPSGMAQEFLWPLALAWSIDRPGNTYFHSEALRQWIVAGMRFSDKSSRYDGSCDDYFPYERAGGAASFSMLAMLDAYQILGLEDPSLIDFFYRRGKWLSRYHESGKLTNHQALVALIMQRLGGLLGTHQFERARDQRLERIFSWQHEEGWYQEYQGFDFGYQTITISLLASMNHERPHAEIKKSLEQAVKISADVIFPDGCNGGEIGSRNTYNFFPHGFELVGRWMPEALGVNDRFMLALSAGRAPCYADDHHIAHHAWNYLLAWRDWVDERPSLDLRRQGAKWRPGAGIVVHREDSNELYINARKGGVFRFYSNNSLRASDTGVSILLKNGKNLVCHLYGPISVNVASCRIEMQGLMSYAKHVKMTTARLVILRMYMIVLGRFFPNFTRTILQKLLIVGRGSSGFRFVRIFERTSSGWRVIDEIKSKKWGKVKSVGIGGSQASIYVTMSRTFCPDQLHIPWKDMSGLLGSIDKDGKLRFEREL